MHPLREVIVKRKSPLAQLPRDAECAYKVRMAVGVAAFNAWSFAVCAAASAVFLAVSPAFGGFSLAGVGITLVLAGVTYCEFRGQRLLQSLDARGCRVLGWNQLGLLAAVALYCIWSIVWGFVYPSPWADHPDWQALERDFGDALWPVLVASIYGGVLIACALYQGGNAWYYFTRRRAVEECRAMGRLPQ